MPLTDEQIENFAHDWAQSPVDWFDYLERMERYLDVDLPEQMLDPESVRIKKITRKVLREKNE